MEVQSDPSGEPLRYPDPVQVDGMIVTRQKGIPSWQQEVRDPVPAQAVIQGSHEIHTTRQVGNGTQHFDASGTLIADTRADDRSVLYVDVATMAAGDANPPPGLARIAAPLVADPNQPVPPRPAFDAASSAPPAVPPSMDKAAIKAMAQAAGFIVSDAPGEVKDSPTTFDVVASDTGSNDPRDMGSAPTVFSADQLPVIKKAPVVPVITAPNALPEPRTRHIRAKAGPTAKSVKKGGKK